MDECLQDSQSPPLTVSRTAHAKFLSELHCFLEAEPVEAAGLQM